MSDLVIKRQLECIRPGLLFVRKSDEKITNEFVQVVCVAQYLNTYTCVDDTLTVKPDNTYRVLFRSVSLLTYDQIMSKTLSEFLTSYHMLTPVTSATNTFYSDPQDYYYYVSNPNMNEAQLIGIGCELIQYTSTNSGSYLIKRIDMEKFTNSLKA